MTRSKANVQVGQMLTFAARRHRARQAAMLSEIGLFPGQEQVLRALMDTDGLTMGEIAEFLRIRPPTASKMAARMGAQGLVERRSSTDDARLVTIHITDEGRVRGAEIDRIARKLERRLLTGFDEKDQRRLRRLLKRAAKNLAEGEIENAADDSAQDEALEDA